jgi:hypothetical protein
MEDAEMKNNNNNLLEREHSIKIVARETFFSALRQSAWDSMCKRLLGKSNGLSSFEDAYREVRLAQQHELGTHPVVIDQIIGSMGRVKDFDRNFFPRNTRSINRWVSIAIAFHKGVGLPAVELYKVGTHYFVKDGNHRISVARAYGQDFIDAAVTEIVIG